MLSVCAPASKNLYKGPELKEEQVARLNIIKPPEAGGAGGYDLEPYYYPLYIDMVKFDDEAVSCSTPPCFLHGYYILPGQHSIELKYVWDSPETSSSEEEVPGPPLCVSDMIFGDEVARAPCRKIVEK
jgi:hypothetical protein